MQHANGPRPHPPDPPDGAVVEVRYWAALRAAAGVAAERVPPGSLADVLASTRASHAATPRFAEVLAICSVLVDEHPVGVRDRAAVDVPAGATVDLLPPFAGGAPQRGTSTE